MAFPWAKGRSTQKTRRLLDGPKGGKGPQQKHPAASLTGRGARRVEMGQAKGVVRGKWQLFRRGVLRKEKEEARNCLATETREKICEGGRRDLANALLKTNIGGPLQSRKPSRRTSREERKKKSLGERNLQRKTERGRSSGDDNTENGDGSGK